MSNQRHPTATAVAIALAAHGHRQSELAGLLGISHTAISRRMRGHTEFTAAELLRIAEWLGVPAGSLIEPPAALAARGTDTDRAA